MKNLCHGSLVLAFCACTLHGAETLTLKQVLVEARQRNPTLASAHLAVQEAEEGATMAAAGFLPSLSAIASYNHSDAQALPMGGFSSNDGYSGALQANWNLFDGFSTQASRMQSLQILDERKASYLLASANLLLGLRQAFSQLVYDQKNAALLEDLAKRYDQDTRYQSLEFSSGHTARWTYLKAESDEATVKWQVKQNALATRSDQAALAALMGRDMAHSGGLELEGDLELSAPPQDDQGELEAVSTNHPSLKQQEALVQANEWALQGSRASRYPSLDASGSYGLSGANLDAPSQNLLQAGLTLKYNLFAGVGQEAAIKQADLALKASNQDLLELRIQVQAALQKAWSNYLGDYERMPVVHMATLAGEERFKTVKSLYEAGRTAFLDYEQAESIYTQAQQQELSEILGAANAQAQYHFALGLGIDEELALEKDR